MKPARVLPGGLEVGSGGIRGLGGGGGLGMVQTSSTHFIW